jgi:glutamate-1-semialdehyde 2,1-aminomutase
VIGRIAEEGAELAAVLVDPVQLPPSPEGMRRLQAAARTAGAVFILDESKTGFRVHLGGVQGLYGLRPDLVVLSKAIANGLPLAVVGGRRDLMRRADAVKIKGTYSNELAAVAAALATIARLREADAPRALAETGTRLLAGLNAVFAAHGVAAQLRAVPFHWPCMPFLHFPDGGQDGLRERFYRELVAAGVLMLPEHMNYVCLAHTEDDLAETFRRVERVLRRIL